MAYNTNPGRAEYIASSGQTDFPFTFKIYETSNIKVYQTPSGQTPNDTTDILTLDTDYSVSINGDNGGQVTLTSGAVSGDQITISRLLPKTRQYEYQTNGDLLADTLNADQDYQTYLAADLEDAVARNLSLPDTAQGVSTELPTPVSDTYIKWDENGTALENVSTVPEAVIRAEAAAEAAEEALDNFDDIYLGAKASDPTTDNDGDPLEVGMWYFNTTVSLPRIYTGTTWENTVVSTSDFYTKTEMDTKLPSMPTSKIVDVTAAKEYEEDYEEATTTTTADYLVGDIIWVTDTTAYYECILDSTSGELLTNTTYFTLRENSLILSSKILYANGYDNGALTSSESVSNIVLNGQTINNVQVGMNYVYKEEGNSTWEATLVEPLFNEVSATGHYFTNGKWYDSTGTALTAPITYAPYIIEIGADGKFVKEYDYDVPTLVDDVGSFKQVNADEFVGKNACTAWVNFDGTTTPPTIRDSFNVRDVVRTATGRHIIYFEKAMTNTDYAIAGTTYGYNGKVQPSNVNIATLTSVGVDTAVITTLTNIERVSVQIFGGKN